MVFELQRDVHPPVKHTTTLCYVSLRELCWIDPADVTMVIARNAANKKSGIPGTDTTRFVQFAKLGASVTCPWRTIADA